MTIYNRYFSECFFNGWVAVASIKETEFKHLGFTG
jgi:hypothetical protein